MKNAFEILYEYRFLKDGVALKARSYFPCVCGACWSVWHKNPSVVDGVKDSVCDSADWTHQSDNQRLAHATMDAVQLMRRPGTCTGVNSKCSMNGTVGTSVVHVQVQSVLWTWDVESVEQPLEGDMQMRHSSKISLKNVSSLSFTWLPMESANCM